MGSIDALKYYFPMLVMIAVTLTESGAPDMFVNLYQKKPNTVRSEEHTSELQSH